MLFKHKPITIPELKEDYSLGKRHYISPEGELLPSVTTILGTLESPGLEEWKKRVGEKEATTTARVSANRGTRLHSVVERYLRNEANPTAGEMPDAHFMFKQMKPMIDRIGLIYLLEGQVYSKTFKYAGRVDIVAEYDHTMIRNSIIDIKTNMSDLQWAPDKVEKYFLQCAAYALAYEELTGINISTGVLIFTSPGYGVEVLVRPLHEYRGKWIKVVSDYHRNINTNKEGPENHAI